ncbi:hypothetical protein K0M31_008497 [Melipona bicolor]|uniref:Uncharacterized protein n=1 Tax=Melipona bicolor TaxID=60889 RepID=A0AA40FR56_9HYME|nr:hypothetical protein K0M31_008497 [Melipona bicolor]
MTWRDASRRYDVRKYKNYRRVQAGTDLEECEELLKYPDLCTSYMALRARTSPAGCTVLGSADIAQYGYL